jgi:hypothetical protein
MGGLPRERQHLVIDRHTGAATVTTEVIDNAGFAERVAGLKGSVPDLGPVEAASLTVACDGCGTRAVLDFEDPRLPGGWASCEAGDFCQGCQSLS